MLEMHSGRGGSEQNAQNLGWSKAFLAEIKKGRMCLLMRLDKGNQEPDPSHLDASVLRGVCLCKFKLGVVGSLNPLFQTGHHCVCFGRRTLP